MQISGNEGKINGLATFTEFPYLQSNPTLNEDLEVFREKLINSFSEHDGEKNDRKSEEIVVNDKKIERLSFSFNKDNVNKKVEVITSISGNKVFNLIFISEEKDNKIFNKTIDKIVDSISINEEMNSKNNLVILEASQPINDVKGLQFNIPENWIKINDGMSNEFISGFSQSGAKNDTSAIDFVFPVNGQAMVASIDMQMKINSDLRNFINKENKKSMVKSMEQAFGKIENTQIEDIEINGVKGISISMDVTKFGIKSHTKMIAVASEKHLNLFMFVTDEFAQDDMNVIINNIIPTIKFV